MFKQFESPNCNVGSLAEENWDNVLAAPDVQQAVCVLEEKIRGHMDRWTISS